MLIARVEFRDRWAQTIPPEIRDFVVGDQVPHLGTSIGVGRIRGKVTDIFYDYDDCTVFVTVN
jgi:hypothetical protein